jgi:uncharacterized protein YbjT (DUF2867 family)
MEKRTIVVCGATGKVGSAVVDSLVSRLHWNITALTRDPEGARALGLRNKCVRILRADLVDKESMMRVFKGAYGVFGITQPFSEDYKKISAATEFDQGCNIIDSCLENNVGHLVLSTVFGPENAEYKELHLASKILIVNYLKNTSLPYTILKPASFMENIGSRYFPVKFGYLKGFTAGSAKVPYISTKDIGQITALVFEQPEKYLNSEINLMADLVSGDDIAGIISKIRNNEPFIYKSMPRLMMKLFAKEFYKMRVSFEKSGYPPYPKEYNQALQACKEIYPQIMSMEQYLIAEEFDKKTLT